MPEAAVCKYFPEAQVFGAPVVWGATWLRPGCSELTTDAEHRYFALGSISGAITPALLELKALLELMCRVELSDNLIGQRWTKLHLNAAYSGLSTVMGSTFGAVSDNDLAVKWAARVSRECVKICMAKGIGMIPGHTSTNDSIDYMKIYDFCDSVEEQRCIDITRDMHKKDRLLVASMLQDLRKNRPCEVESIIGVVVEEGKVMGIPTPYAAAVREVIRKKQAGQLPVDYFPVEFYPGV